MTEPALILPTQLGQALLDYLVTKPYREVYQLVAALQALQPVDSGAVADAAEVTTP